MTTSRTPRGVRVRWRFAPLLTSVLIVLMLNACGDPPDPTEADALINLVASGAVGGGQVTFIHGAGEVISAKPLRSGLIVSAATEGGLTTVAWVGPRSAGPQVQVAFDLGPTTSTPTVGSVMAYRTSDEALSASVISAQPAETTAPNQPGMPSSEIVYTNHDAELDSAFADFQLGDVDASGTVDVRDALLALEIIAKPSDGDARMRYLADTDGNYRLSTTDVAAMIAKAVDPDLPAVLVVKPRALSFVQLDGSTSAEAVVLIGNGGNEPLAGVSLSDAGLSVDEDWTIFGQSAVLELGEPAAGWLPTHLHVSGAGSSYSVRLGNLVILIGGQSNATAEGAPLTGWSEYSQNDPNVRMLGNDYVWRNARESLDDPTGQLDAISFDDDSLYSFGTRLGNLLYEAQGFSTYLIPSALGGSCITGCNTSPSWLPAANRLDRDTLFGSANFRGHVSAGWRDNPGSGNLHAAEGGPVNVLVWYQGEADVDNSTERNAFKSGTITVLDQLSTQLFGGVGQGAVVFMQLASDGREQQNIRAHAVAELQRQLELEKSSYYMVVTDDLPRSDRIHLSAFAQRELGRRISLAIREHVFGEDVDGTGPRLVSVTYAGNQVFIETDKQLQVGAFTTTNRFAVFDGAPSPSNIDDFDSYGSNRIGVSSAAVLAGDPYTVVLTLLETPSTAPYVRYMSPPVLPETQGNSNPELWQIIAPGVIRGQATDLPLPAFGPLIAVAD